MKTLSNTKEDAVIVGVVLYRMERIVAGVKLAMVVAVTKRELRDGRTVVAYRLVRARHDLRRMVAIAAREAVLGQPPRVAAVKLTMEPL